LLAGETQSKHQTAQTLIAFQIHSVKERTVKRIFVVFLVVWMFSMLAAFIPYALPQSEDEYHRRRTPTPRPPSGTLTAPALISPANGTTVHTGNLTWSWSPVPGAARYHLQAGGGTAFDQQYNIIEYWGLTDPSYTFNVTSGFVFYFRTLYWRVQAIDANHVQGPWSEVRVIHLVSP
jgi:hypothetical protein